MEGVLEMTTTEATKADISSEEADVSQGAAAEASQAKAEAAAHKSALRELLAPVRTRTTIAMVMQVIAAVAAIVLQAVWRIGSRTLAEMALHPRWWFDVLTTEPLTFASRTLASGTATSVGQVVTGAVKARNTADQDIYVIGSGTQYHSQQDHLKLKLAYDVTPELRASYVLGLWQNSAEGR